jgi:hypothetical protein
VLVRVENLAAERCAMISNYGIDVAAVASSRDLKSLINVFNHRQSLEPVWLCIVYAQFGTRMLIET